MLPPRVMGVWGSMGSSRSGSDRATCRGVEGGFTLWIATHDTPSQDRHDWESLKRDLQAAAAGAAGSCPETSTEEVAMIRGLRSRG